MKKLVILLFASIFYGLGVFANEVSISSDLPSGLVDSTLILLNDDVKSVMDRLHLNLKSISCIESQILKKQLIKTKGGEIGFSNLLVSWMGKKLVIKMIFLPKDRKIFLLSITPSTGVIVRESLSNYDDDSSILYFPISEKEIIEYWPFMTESISLITKAEARENKIEVKISNINDIKISREWTIRRYCNRSSNSNTFCLAQNGRVLRPVGDGFVNWINVAKHDAVMKNFGYLVLE